MDGLITLKRGLKIFGRYIFVCCGKKYFYVYNKTYKWYDNSNFHGKSQNKIYFSISS